MGPQAVLYAILDEVVDQYVPVVAGLENDIDEIEDELFSAGPDVARRIYLIRVVERVDGFRALLQNAYPSRPRWLRSGSVRGVQAPQVALKAGKSC